ncbi:MAG: cupin domain-containing protein [Thainema sp.]
MSQPQPESQPSLLKAADIEAIGEFEFHHPLNPNSEVYLRSLSRATGLNRIGVTLARIPPGKESFIYHAHSNEEEWIYILSGRGIAEIDEAEYEVAAGDFLGFGLPQKPHHLRNPFDQELVYLVGGEQVKVDIGTFPHHGKRAIRDGETAYLIDEANLTDFWQA